MNPTQDIQRVVDLIQSESLEHLRDPAYLEYRLLPLLGLNDRHMHQYPSHLHAHCGTGIDSWQYPNQFSRYLVHLSTLGLTSYCEIGCHKGGTFIITVEYLRRFNDIHSALAVDNWSRDRMIRYSELRPEVEYLPVSSLDSSFLERYAKQAWDLVLIDGDHSYQGVRKDFDQCAGRARYIAFHDIVNSLCPGTQQIWAEMKQRYPANKLHTWTDQYDEVLLRMRGSIMGIGLVDNT